MSDRDHHDVGEGQQLEDLDRDTCIELLARHQFVGRLGFVVDGRPMILPVNYIFDTDSVVFCTTGGTKLNSVVSRADVVFEVDDSSALHQSGWSVVVRGQAEVITDAEQLERLRDGPLRPWAGGARATWVRISLDEISGRRIPGV